MSGRGLNPSIPIRAIRTMPAMLYGLIVAFKSQFLNTNQGNSNITSGDIYQDKRYLVSIPQCQSGQFERADAGWIWGSISSTSPNPSMPIRAIRTRAASGTPRWRKRCLNPSIPIRAMRTSTIISPNSTRFLSLNSSIQIRAIRTWQIVEGCTAVVRSLNPSIQTRAIHPAQRVPQSISLQRNLGSPNPTRKPHPPSIPPLHRNPPQPKRRPLADVQDLGGAQQGHEGGQVPFEVQLSQQASEEHLGLLAVAVALLVVPGEVRDAADRAAWSRRGRKCQSTSAPGTWNQASSRVRRSMA